MGNEVDKCVEGVSPAFECETSRRRSVSVLRTRCVSVRLIEIEPLLCVLNVSTRVSECMCVCVCGLEFVSVPFACPLLLSTTFLIYNCYLRRFADLFTVSVWVCLCVLDFLLYLHEPNLTRNV